MSQVLDNIEVEQVLAEMIRRGIKPRQRVRVVFEPVDDDALALARLAEQGGAFDWLKDEPDIYTLDDVKRRNA